MTSSELTPIEVLVEAQESLWVDEMRGLMRGAELGLFSLEELEAQSGLSVWVGRSGDLVHTSAFCRMSSGPVQQQSLSSWLLERESVAVCPSCAQRGSLTRGLPVEWREMRDEDMWGAIRAAAQQLSSAPRRLSKPLGAHRLAGWVSELNHLGVLLSGSCCESLEALRLSGLEQVGQLRSELSSRLALEVEQVRHWMAQEILTHSLAGLEWPEAVEALLEVCEEGVSGWAHPRAELAQILFGAWRRSCGRERAGLSVEQPGWAGFWFETSKVLGRIRSRLECIHDGSALAALEALVLLERDAGLRGHVLEELDALLGGALGEILAEGGGEARWLLGVARRTDGPVRSVLEVYEAGAALGGARLASGAQVELALLDALGARWAKTLGEGMRAELVEVEGLTHERALVIAQLWERGVADAALGSLTTAELISRCVEP